MNKKPCQLFFLTAIFTSLIVFSACSGLTNNSNMNTLQNQEQSICITLPYGSSSREIGSNGISYTFDVVFTHQQGKSEVIRGYSGETVTFENAPLGNYSILVIGYDFAKEGCFTGQAETTVYPNQTSVVEISVDPQDLQDLPNINLWSSNEYYTFAIQEYINKNPECGFTVTLAKIESEDFAGTVQYLLGKDSIQDIEPYDYPDLFNIEYQMAAPFVTGPSAKYTMPYENLGIDIQEGLKQADIFDYIVKTGTDKNGVVKGLGYQSTAGGFIYKRELAKQAFGTDDPDQIAQLIGAGTDNWTKFIQAAEKAAEKNLFITHSFQDLWLGLSGGVKHPYMESDGKTVQIPEQSINFLKAIYELTANNCLEKNAPNEQWSEEWNAAFENDKVIGFFGPVWLLFSVAEYMDGLADSAENGEWAFCRAPVDFLWGGSLLFAYSYDKNGKTTSHPEKIPALKQILEYITLDTSIDGHMYKTASTKEGFLKDCVSSQTVLDKVDGSASYYGDQNLLQYVAEASKALTADDYYLDNDINQAWLTALTDFFEDEEGFIYKKKDLYEDDFDKLKEDFIEDFKQALQDIKGNAIEIPDYECAYMMPPTGQSTHIIPEPYDGGVKLTLIFADGDTEWDDQSCWISNDSDGIALFPSELPTSQNRQISYYYPVNIKKNRDYTFVLHFRMKDDPYEFVERVYSKAGGGKTYVEYDPQLTDWEHSRKDSPVSVSFSKDSDTGIITGNLKLDSSIENYISWWDESVYDKEFDYDIISTNSDNWIEFNNGILWGVKDYDDLDWLKDEGYSWELESRQIMSLQDYPYYYGDVAIRFKVPDLPEDKSDKQYFRLSPLFSPNYSTATLQHTDSKFVHHPNKKDGFSLDTVAADESTGKPAGLRLTFPTEINGEPVKGAQFGFIKIYKQEDDSIDHWAEDPVGMHYVPGNYEYIYPFVDKNSYYEALIFYQTDQNEYELRLGYYNTYQGYKLEETFDFDKYDKIKVEGRYNTSDEYSCFSAKLLDCDFNSPDELVINSTTVSNFDIVYTVYLGGPEFTNSMFWANIHKEPMGGNFGDYLEEETPLNRYDDTGVLIRPSAEEKQNHDNHYTFNSELRFTVAGLEIYSTNGAGNQVNEYYYWLPHHWSPLYEF